MNGRWKREVTVPLAPPFSWCAAAAWTSAPPRPTIAVPAFLILPLPVPVSALVGLGPVSCCAALAFHLLFALLFLFLLLLLFLLLPPFLTLFNPFCSCSFSLNKLKWRQWLFYLPRSSICVNYCKPLSKCLTCSSVSGSQYMQGGAFVLRNRSSSSFAGGSSAGFSGKANSTNIKPKSGLFWHIHTNAKSHLSCQLFSPCSFLSPYVVFLWSAISGDLPPSLLLSQTLWPCHGPTPVLLEPSPGAPSRAHARPTGLVPGGEGVNLMYGHAHKQHCAPQVCQQCPSFCGSPATKPRNAKVTDDWALWTQPVRTRSYLILMREVHAKNLWIALRPLYSVKSCPRGHCLHWAGILHKESKPLVLHVCLRKSKPFIQSQSSLLDKTPDCSNSQWRSSATWSCLSRNHPPPGYQFCWAAP